jgi:diguanylate cyclase (GGDEF)-like protein/PAS domain S-box-containing protein
LETNVMPEFSPWHSLKTRVTFSTLATFVLGIWSLSFYISRTLQEDMERLLSEQQMSVVTAVADEVNDNLVERLQALETIAKEVDAGLLDNPASLKNRLEQRPLLQLLFNAGVFVTKQDGIAVADWPPLANRLGINYMDRDFMVAALKEGKSAIGHPVIGKRLKSPIFAMSTPVRDAHGKVIGAIVGVVNLAQHSFLDKIAENTYGKTGGYVLISAKQRLVVTATDKSRVMERLPPEGVNAWVDRFASGYEGSAISPNPKGVTVLVSAKGIPAAGWYVLATLPTSEAFAPVYAMRLRLLWATLALTLLIGGLTWWILRRQLAPMAETASAMASLADTQQIPQPLALTHRGEIGQLVASFNRILQTWAHREESLKTSETFKDAILNSLEAEIAVVDRQGVILAVNTRWQQFALANSVDPGATAQHTGVGANYLAVCRLASDLEPDGRLTAHAGLQAVLEGRLSSFSCEYPCDTPAQQRWFAMIAMPLGKPGEGGAVISHTDISPRKQAEQAMQHMKTLMERTESMAHLASFQWEVDANTVIWSPEMFQIFGLDPAQGAPNLEGQAQLYTPASTQNLYDAVSKALAGGMPYHLELTAVRPDGEQRPCDVRGFPQRDGSGRVVRITGLVQDITERKQAEAAFKASEERWKFAIEGAGDGLWDWNIQTGQAFFSSRYKQMFGYVDADFGTTSDEWSKRIHPEDAPGVFAELQPYLEGKPGSATVEFRMLCKDGSWLWTMGRGMVVERDAAGKPLRMIGTNADISERKAHENQLEHIAHFDSLTNLPNRVLLADRLQQAMAQDQRRGQQLAVAYLDLDGFKVINDRHGHESGDQVLITLAKRMKEALREGDTLARIGGDEFVVVLIDLEDPSASLPMLNRLLAAAALPVQVGGRTLQVSASLGVTFFPQAQDIDADQLLRQADQAMYQAKLAGKNCYQIFDAALDSSMRVQHESLERIRLALHRREFVLHYQPKVNMQKGQVIGAEALIRWQHPEKGLLAPASFLPVIENHPLAVDVGEWVIHTALTQMETWQAGGMSLPVSVNIGARQLQQSDFVPRLRAILNEHPQVHSGCLELEVLETSALADIAQVAQVIEECAEIGVKFSLDDFGTGYSSLTYLKRLHVAQLKIDQSFVRDMLDDSEDLAILQGVIGLASAFNREVIAEGVESAAHGAALLKLGCQLAQGNGIAWPMSPEQMPAWVKTWQPDAAWCALS